MPLTINYDPIETHIRNTKLRNKKEVAKQADEIVRNLEITFPYHSWGKADTKEGRAAAVICHVAQKEGQTIELHQNLGLRKATLNQLQSTIASYLQQQKRKLSSKTDEKETKKVRRGTLGELAIRLTSADPNIPKRAAAFLERLKDYVYKLPLHQRRSHIQDMNQHREAYEAAAFLVVSENTVEVEDVVRAMPDLAHSLPDIYEHVKKLAEKIPKREKQKYVAPKQATTRVEVEDVEMLPPEQISRENIEKEKDAMFQKWKEEILLKTKEDFETMLKAADAVLQKHGITMDVEMADAAPSTREANGAS